MDLCDDLQNVLSSEEYSDDDDLMNAAISANKKFNASETKPSTKVVRKKLPTKKSTNKNVFKIKKYASLAKKRSVNWLNSKKKREKYKEQILKDLKENAIGVSSTVVNTCVKTNGCSETVLKQRDASPNNFQNLDSSKDRLKLDEEKIGENFKFEAQKDEHAKYTNSRIRHLKRSVSVPPNLVNHKFNSLDSETQISKNSLLFKEVNKLFPKYHKVLKDFVSASTNSVESIEMKISEILIEIQELSDIIQTKEFEWNKLLHLRKVKEEIIMQLARKKSIMELNKNNISKKHLKMLESEKIDSFKSTYSENFLKESRTPQSTAQALIEHRANMKKEDLEKEGADIKKLHSLLVSQKILPSSRSSNITKMVFDTSIKTSVSDTYAKLATKTFQENNTDVMESHNQRIQMCGDTISNHCSIDEMHLRRINVLQRNEEESIRRSSRHLLNIKQNLNENEVPLCQACNSHKSRFLCAGCANQWYCSRKCQISAWDQHSHSCKE